jgi:hypothetical protein
MTTAAACWLSWAASPLFGPSFCLPEASPCGLRPATPPTHKEAPCPISRLSAATRCRRNVRVLETLSKRAAQGLLYSPPIPRGAGMS